MTKLLLTDQRVIALKRGLLSERFKDFELNEITTIEYNESFMWSAIFVKGPGFKSGYRVNGDIGRKFVSATHG